MRTMKNNRGGDKTQGKAQQRFAFFLFQKPKATGEFPAAFKIAKFYISSE